MNPKLVKPLIILVVSMVIFSIGAFAGYTFCKRAQYAGVIKQQEKDAKIVMKHLDRKEEVRKNVNAIIETKVQNVVDSTGCLDADSPDIYINGLLDADRAAKSGFD